MNIELVREIRDLVLREVTVKDIMALTALRGTDINFIIRLDKVISEDWQNEIKLLKDKNIKLELDIKSQNDNLTQIANLEKEIISLRGRDLEKDIIAKDKEFRNLEKNYLKEISENEKELRELHNYIDKIPSMVKKLIPE